MMGLSVVAYRSGILRGARRRSFPSFKTVPVARMIEVGRTWKSGAMGILLLASAVAHGAEVRVFAAGSLRLALDEAIAAYAERTGVQVVALYGPSGKLRQMIEGGDVPDLFLSASLEHTAALQRRGVLRTSEPITRNSLCLMAAPGISVERGKVVEVMLDPTLRLGTATPKTDPAGDYTWEMFRKVDQLRPGAYATLDAKALRLTGREVAKEGKGLPYPALFQGARKTDVFVSYCTNAVATAKAVPGLTWQRLPDDIDVAAVYGAGLSAGVPEQTESFLRFLESAEGRGIFERYGFQ
jgi:ABC-type molybdate transport system substrate-binding protein